MTDIADSDFIPTLTARPNLPDNVGRPLQTAYKLEPILDLDLEGRRYVTVHEAIVVTEQPAKVLYGIGPHPVDGLGVYVDVESLRSLTVVAGRVSPRQQDMLAPDSIADLAREEVSRCESEMRPLLALAREARTEKIDAEKLVSTLQAAPDPKVALRRYLSIDPSGAEVSSDNLVFTPPSTTALPKTYAAKTTYSIGAKINWTNHTKGEIKVTLLSFEQDCPLFTESDLYRRAISIQIVQDGHSALLLQAMLCDAPLNLRVTMRVQISSKGLEYTGTLDEIEDPSRIRKLFAQYSRSLQQELDM